ncbi:MAG: hypothetical protein P4L33_02810 [Capsulimonadaceae bacterium]|nr:hypothetical protein [Capsulimonadaceae bacterium]
MALRRTFLYLIVLSCVVSLLLLPAITNVYQAGLDKPIEYQHDALAMLAQYKGLIETGWVTHNPNVGAPAGQNLRSLPFVDDLDYVLEKLIAATDPNPAIVLNVLFILSFPLAAGTATFVALRLGLRPATSAAIGILFAFAPYHFLRCERHIFLSIYYSVPFTFLLLYDIRSGRADIVARIRERGWGALAPSFGYVALAILCGINGIYYCLIPTVLIAGTTFVSALDTRKLSVFLSGLTFSVIMVATLGLCSVPFLTNPARHAVANTVIRKPTEVEKYGLTIAQMILPTPAHRIAALSKLRDKFDRSMLPEITNENGMAALGAAGTIGFILLLAAPFVRSLQIVFRKRMILSLVVYIALLWCTIGGLSATSTVFLPAGLLRSLNRVSIFISFCSLCALGMVADQLATMWEKRGARPLLAALAWIPIVVLGAYDQSPASFAAPNPYVRRYLSDEQFGQVIDASLPPGAMIYNIPYVPYPEGAITGLGDYDEFRPYLHTHHVRYSYGAIRETGADDWQRRLPVDVSGFVAALSKLGFRAIVLDTRYLVGSAWTLPQARALIQACHASPTVSSDANFVFIPINTLVEAPARLR